jgi:hypothetical protein
MKVKSKSAACFIVFYITLLLLVTNCGKQSTEGPKVSESNKIEIKIPRILKPLKIGQSADFAILAYSSISSNFNSSINGKVGLLPGTHDQIDLDPSEVDGGIADILGSDDETIPLNLLSNAKVDMVTAYKEAVNLIPDNDKVNLFNGNISSKVLMSGCYKWNDDLIIENDFTIEGSESDVWIFKIPANFKVGSGVHLTLSGGARASNIFWQVAGTAILESGSVMFGTIIAQQSVELKSKAKLTGRAFAKNGFVNLNQATIKRP